ncbi:hypothetical protein P280DRAFT_143876 [Massarina eburnea CBS 473.64]|uniref:Rhodopsin domain-containing protein n=1 Tax=Massarina eburnea CBS 473.64 TaxID=1395130 RepID=A0A6A6RNM0_9PLEO|nr:hypothetical protein P280DRAFT_143876 [Massarina eburnea CBS 473.64]
MRPIALGIATGPVVLTDCLILAMPFLLPSKVKKLVTRKILVLHSLFSVEVVAVIVAIVRCVIATKGMDSDKDLQVTMLLFLTHMEANLVIIVVCVGSLHSLFDQDNQTRSGSNATPKSQLKGIHINGKTIDLSSSVRPIPLTNSSSNAHKEIRRLCRHHNYLRHRQSRIVSIRTNLERWDILLKFTGTCVYPDFVYDVLTSISFTLFLGIPLIGTVASALPVRIEFLRAHPSGTT